MVPLVSWLSCTFYQQILLSNLRRFDIYRQYIGADCTSSVSLGSPFFRRFWPLIIRLCNINVYVIPLSKNTLVRHYKSLHPKTEVDYTFLVEEHVARSNLLEWLHWSNILFLLLNILVLVLRDCLNSSFLIPFICIGLQVPRMRWNQKWIGKDYRLHSCKHCHSDRCPTSVSYGSVPNFSYYN